MFNLEKEIVRWRKALGRNSSISESDLAELESHLRDEIDHQRELGLDAEAAFRKAREASASTDDLGREYEKFRPRDSRRPFWHPARFLPAAVWSHLKIAVRLIRRQKMYAAISIFGLAVGLASFILFFLSWRYEKSYDRFHERADRIFRVEMDWREFGPVEHLNRSYPGFAPEARQNLPGIRAAVRFNTFRKPLVKVGDRMFRETSAIAADPEIFEVFTFPVLRGEGASALRGSESVLLSASTARKFFGPVDPLGQKIRISLTWGASRTRDYDFTVSGILADTPPNATYGIEILLPLEIVNRLVDMPGFTDTWKVGMPPFLTFLLLDEAASVPELERGLTDLVIRRSGTTSIQKIVLNPLVSLHAADPNQNKYLKIFGALGLIVLLLACLNTVNLSMARATQRIKEVGIKIIVGAGRKLLIRQFLAESLVASFLSMILSIGLILAVLPLFQAATGRILPVDRLFDAELGLEIAGLAVLVGLLSGAYPAIYLSRIKPVELFQKSRLEKTSKSVFRKSLVFVQFAGLGVLMISGGVVARQLRYIENADLGMDPDNIMVIRLEDNRVRYHTALPGFRNALTENPGVSAISAAFGAFPDAEVSVQIQAPWAKDPERMNWNLMTTDAGFPDLFRVPLVEGRSFSPDERTSGKAPAEALINETAARRLGEGSPLGRELREFFHGDDFAPLRIIGVFKDFHSRSLHHPIEPVVVTMRSRGSLLCVKLRPEGLGQTITAVQTLWKQFFPDFPIDFYFMTDDFRNAYASEARLGLISQIFSGLSIVIAVLGLFGLVAFNTEQRRKEIGIRKVLGAGAGRMTAMFLREYEGVVLLSNLAAWPLAFVAGSRWLRGFAYRTDLPPALFILSTLAAAGLAAATVAFQVRRAARLNPAQTLRQD